MISLKERKTSRLHKTEAVRLSIIYPLFVILVSTIISFPTSTGLESDKQERMAGFWLELNITRLYLCTPLCVFQMHSQRMTEHWQPTRPSSCISP